MVAYNREHPVFNRDDCEFFLRQVSDADGNFAVRSLRPQQEWRWPKDRLPEMSAQIERMNGSRQWYAILNPVQPDCTAPYVKDENISTLRWFPIDVDPVRPSDTSSTDEELHSACAKQSEVLAFLTRLCPGIETSLITAYSGNGRQALIRLPDYPVAEQPRLKAIGDALSRKFSTDEVKLDTAVFNASRIWRIPGTMNIKGAPTADRPHRIARLDARNEPAPFDLLDHWTDLDDALGISQRTTRAFVMPAGPARHPTSDEPGQPDVQTDKPELPPRWRAPVPPGERNNNAYQAARWLVNNHEGNRSEKDAWAELDQWNNTHCDPPLDRDELRNTFESAAKKGPNPDFVDATTADPWEPPIPFGTFEVPTFPTIALPPIVRDYVTEIAESMQVPADMAAMIALAIMAAAVSRRFTVQIGKTHSEPCCLYVVVAMPPGSRKTQTIAALDAPLRDAERDAAISEEVHISNAKELRAIEEKRLETMRSQAGKATTADDRMRFESDAMAIAANRTTVPPTPRLLVDDVTPEKLADLMAEQGGYLALVSAEGGIFGTMAGRYSNGVANLDLFLKGHAGEPYRVDRISRGTEKPIFIQRAVLTLALTVQPEVLRSLSDNTQFRGRGVLGRILFCIPEPLVGTRLYRDRPIDRHIRDDWHRLVRGILDIPPRRTDRGEDAPHELQFAPEALEVWRQYHDDIEQRQADYRDLSGIRDWASKLAGAVARIAACLHVAHNADGQPWDLPISAETAAAAWAIGEYLVPHALAAFAEMGNDRNRALAQQIAKWIERESKTTFTKRDCFNAHRSHNLEEIGAAIAFLEQTGHIRAIPETPRQGAGRKPSPSYAVNPLIHNPHNTQNTQNGLSGTTYAESAESARGQAS